MRYCAWSDTTARERRRVLAATWCRTRGNSARRTHVPSRAHSAGTSDDAAGPKLRSVRLRSGITDPDLFRFGWAGRVADNVSSQRDAAFQVRATGRGAGRRGSKSRRGDEPIPKLNKAACRRPAVPGIRPDRKAPHTPERCALPGTSGCLGRSLVGCNRREPYCTEPLGRWV